MEALWNREELHVYKIILIEVSEKLSETEWNENNLILPF